LAANDIFHWLSSRRRIALAANDFQKLSSHSQ
jgi:hypothetical protein